MIDAREILRSPRPWRRPPLAALVPAALALATGLAMAQPGGTAAPAIDAATQETGSRVYSQVCRACHEAAGSRAPPRFTLQQLTPDSIYRTLTRGVMRLQAGALRDAERRAVAEFLARRPLGVDDADSPSGRCAHAAPFGFSAPPELSGWGLNSGNTHAIPGGISGASRDNVKQLTLKWAFGFPHALRARSQPAIAGGLIFVGSQDSTVYALDLDTGCTRWAFRADADVRTGLMVSPWRSGDRLARPLVYFGDLTGHVYAVSALSGELEWKESMDSHPTTTLTGTPALDRNVLYVPVSSIEEGAAADPNYGCCTFRGSLAALDARTGREIWRTFMTDVPRVSGRNANGREFYAPSGASVWSSPALDLERRQLYVATGNSNSSPASTLSDSVVALDMATGKIRWHYQALAHDAWNISCRTADAVNCPSEHGPDFEFGAAPLLVHGVGRPLVLAGQKSGDVYALDPRNGALAWRQRIGSGGTNGGIHFGLAAEQGRLFVPLSDMPANHPPGLQPMPGLFALDVATGQIVWRNVMADECAGKAACHPGIGGAITTTGGLVIAGGNDGILRAYDAATGVVLWRTDTAREYDTVNGIKARGGSIGGGAAPLAYHGLLIASSGYAWSEKMPGNVLLVYDVRR